MEALEGQCFSCNNEVEEFVQWLLHVSRFYIEIEFKKIKKLM